MGRIPPKETVSPDGAFKAQTKNSYLAMLTNILPTEAEPHSAVPVEPIARCESDPHLPFAVRPPLDSVATAQRPEVLTGAPRPGTSIQRIILASTSRTVCGTGCRSLGPRKPHPLLFGCLSERARARRANSQDGPDSGGNSWNDLHCATAAATRPQRRSDG